MKQPSTTPVLLFSALCLLAIGGGLGWWLANAAHPETPKPAQTASTITPAPGKILYWYDPMMPQQHFDKPGKSPFMDMQLVAKYADDSRETGLAIDPVVSQNIGMRLAKVSRIMQNRQVEVSGLLSFNERDIAIVQTRSSGFVERMPALAVGDEVKAGQALLELMVPEWAAAQQEYLVVRNMADQPLVQAAKERLLLLGMPAELIRQLEQTARVHNRYTIIAPISGVIQSLEVRQGMTLMNGQTVARINGLSKIWLDAALPEAQSDVVQLGNQAEIKINAYPDMVFTGRITAILPTLNETSRTIKVRIELDNALHRLRPGMSAQIRLNSRTTETALAIPTEALIRTGKRTLVMLAGEHGRFTPQEISVAHEHGDMTIISSGLQEGQQVVASGQFLIDSEASLNSIEAHTPDNSEHQHSMDAKP